MLRSGLTYTHRGPLFLAAITVLDNDVQGPSPGILAFGRFLTPDIVSEVRNAVKIDFSISPKPTTDPEKWSGMSLENQYRTQDGTFIWHLTNINDNPLLEFTIHLQKRKFSDSTFNLPTILAFVITLACWMTIIYYQQRSLVLPINNLSYMLHKIRKTGDYSLRTKTHGRDEVGMLGEECNRLLDYIETQQNLLNEQTSKLQRLSYEDGLTGLANRRRFDQLLDDYWSFSERESMPLALLFCDVDHFKRYNDYHGHLLGDNALTLIAQAIRDAVTRRSSLAARYGGEEFAVVLPNTDAEGALQVAEQMLDNVRALGIPHKHPTVRGTVSISIGIAIIRPTAENRPKDLIQNADQALYAAKGSGRDRVELFLDR